MAIKMWWRKRGGYAAYMRKVPQSSGVEGDPVHDQDEEEQDEESDDEEPMPGEAPISLGVGYRLCAASIFVHLPTQLNTGIIYRIYLDIWIMLFLCYFISIALNSPYLTNSPLNIPSSPE